MSTDTTTPDPRLTDAYAPAGYDEMWDAGRVRPHWEAVIAAFSEAGMPEIERWRQDTRRHLRENGVTYSIQDDPSSTHRPWQLDTIPFVIGGTDWAGIEAGLAQRAELLNRILLDVYGPNRLVKSGLLPPELVHAHAGYLRPCDGIQTDRPLRFYAADLARGPDGRMWVLRDRTQSPDGIGYALENRTVISQTMPQMIGGADVRRLARFFQAFVAGVEEVNRSVRRSPRTVFLTPGPFSDRYFEHTYLAAYLGYPLVRGDDLTVRDGTLRLKTVEGLQEVDVIVRGVEDRFCDPLELAPDSTLGVPGLVEAVRRGSVGIVNGLGCGVVQNAGLNPFLPGIARELLGEDLRLDSAATWWCGQKAERDHVLANLDQLLVGSIDRTDVPHAVFGPDLSAAELNRWRDRIAAEPHRFIGQEIMTFSTLPTLNGERLEPRHGVLTAFATAGENTYHVMPGGLTRTTADRESRVVSSRSAVLSKDTWVLGTESEPYVSLWLNKSEWDDQFDSSLPSQTAENLFWVGRYAERAEGLARLMRLIVRHLVERDEFEDPAREACLDHLVRSLATLTDPPADDAPERKIDSPEAELLDIVVNADRPGSLSSAIRSLSRAAYATRGRWSADSWRIIESLDDHWPDPSTTYLNTSILRNRLNQLLTGLAAFGGLNQESMTHELGWRILDVGRRIERGQIQVELLASTLVPRLERPVTNLLLESVLVASESLMTYRRRNRGVLQLPAILDLLLFDPINPRSVAHQMERLEAHFKALPHRSRNHRLQQHEKLIIEAHTRLKVTESASLAQERGKGAERKKLAKLLENTDRALSKTSDAISHAFFQHTESARQLSGGGNA